ncbi:hypothetical protein MESS2_1670018 [Mesorhizobium metallidurans STM 2683]|uniref:Uncharacterized protein n=1 Tax=Mesorhizobium metallidurans STM 2683 TaxID=1297569 RepID=M5EM16_9HYPH|nr:hypothetical protein MESS2_1670018 [Mesorhizobium metallidurans STM 2683]
MGHDRHAARGEEADRLGHGLAPLELHRCTTGLRHQARSVAEGLLGAFFIGTEWQVYDHQCSHQTAAHRLAVHDHHVESDAQRRREAVQDHADAVANENDVAVSINQSGDRRSICRQADEWSLAFPHSNIRRCHRLCLTSCAQPTPPSLALPAAGVAFGIFLCECEELKKDVQLCGVDVRTASLTLNRLRLPGSGQPLSRTWTIRQKEPGKTKPARRTKSKWT